MHIEPGVNPIVNEMNSILNVSTKSAPNLDNVEYVNNVFVDDMDNLSENAMTEVLIGDILPFRFIQECAYNSSIKKRLTKPGLVGKMGG